MFGHSLQEKTELLFGGRGTAAEYFKGLRNSIVDRDYKADELSLGVSWAVVQQLCRFRGELGDQARLGEALATAFWQGMTAKHHSQKFAHYIHGSIFGLNVFVAALKGFLEGNRSYLSR